jgi:hypothetical protein
MFVLAITHAYLSKSNSSKLDSEPQRKTKKILERLALAINKHKLSAILLAVYLANAARCVILLR